MDAYRMGGRETFLRLHAEELKTRGSVVGLLASVIEGAPPGNLFAISEQVGSEISDLERWRICGAMTIAELKPDLIWAQHHGLLPAVTLASEHNLPLLCSFHGPVRGKLSPSDALGAALALHRTSLVTAVSEEVLDEIKPLSSPHLEVVLLPNRVRVVCSAKVRSTINVPTRIVMLTRATKLGHIRAGVDFLVAWRQSVGPATLAVHSDIDRSTLSDARRLLWLSNFLGRKWLLRRPSRIRALNHVHFAAKSEEPAEAVANADLILGMGRAALEGLAGHKPVVLIGYESAAGLIDDSSFYAFFRSNFSGRGIQPDSLNVIVQDVFHAMSLNQGVQRAIIDTIDIVKSWGTFEQLLLNAASAPPPSAPGLAEVQSVEKKLLNGESINSSASCLTSTEILAALQLLRKGA